MTDYFSQSAHRIRLRWGRYGAARAAEAGDVLVVVDVLRFSSAVVSAVHHGVTVVPCHWDDDPAELAERLGVSVGTLSPTSYLDAERGSTVVVKSRNGATCVGVGGAVPRLFVGALLNAGATAAAVSREMRRTGAAVTVLACGEQWDPPGPDGHLRVALEDALGAGAILACLEGRLSPEAELCASAFRSAAVRLRQLLLTCGGGVELVDWGRKAEVELAARLDLYPQAVVLENGCLTASQ